MVTSARSMIDMHGPALSISPPNSGKDDGMRMKWIVMLVGVFASGAILTGRAGERGIQLVVTVEARRLAGADVSEQIARIIQTLLPGGRADVTYVTDGKAVRGTPSASVFGFEAGVVKLVPAGSVDVYSLNTGNRTYKVVSGNAKPFNAPVKFHLQPTGRTKTMLGLNARQVTGWLRVDPPSFPGEQQHISEVRADIDNWCTSTITIPPAMSRMMDIVTRIAGGPPDVQYAGTCPLALQSSVRVSVLPGYEIVSTVTSLRHLAQIPPDTFQIPAGYRRMSTDGTAPGK